MVTISTTLERWGEIITISSHLTGTYADQAEIKAFLQTCNDVRYEINQEKRRVEEAMSATAATSQGEPA